MITLIPMQLIHSFAEPVELDGQKFRARVYGEEQWDGCWHAYVAFFAKGRRGVAPVATDRDCVAQNRVALSWWASGLTTDYLRHALKRAIHLEANPEERSDARIDVPMRRDARSTGRPS